QAFSASCTRASRGAGSKSAAWVWLDNANDRVTTKTLRRLLLPRTPGSHAPRGNPRRDAPRPVATVNGISDTPMLGTQSVPVVGSHAERGNQSMITHAAPEGGVLSCLPGPRWVTSLTFGITSPAASACVPLAPCRRLQPAS